MVTEAKVSQRTKYPFVSALPTDVLNLLSLVSSSSSKEIISSEEIIRVRKK